MDLFIIGIVLFIMTAAIIELLVFAYRNMGSVKESAIKKRMKKFVYAEDEAGLGNITKTRVMSDIPFLNAFILKTPGILKLDTLILQANAPYPLGFYILLTILLGVLGYLIPTMAFHVQSLPAVLLGVIFAYLPFLQLKQKKEKRVEKFREQLHEGLDMIARALRAGHAFSTAMKLAASEFEDPLGPEFEVTLNEINFGVGVPDALKNMAERIACPEIKYFVVAVVIQRESGGNLAEVMESLASVIRDKYSFEGKVRTLSAEAKVSAIILTLLPFFIAGWIYITTPSFLEPLFREPIGRMMLIGAAILMGLGILVMKIMVKIEV